MGRHSLLGSLRAGLAGLAARATVREPSARGLPALRQGSLALLAAVSLAACGNEPVPRQAGAEPHARLACAACHQGGLADRELAAVPSGACVASGCHGNEVPADVTIQTVRFTHRGHGSTGSVAIGCAGCHTHQAGGDSLKAGPGTCGLCHAEELSGARGEDCRLCHATLEHDGLTSQGVAIPHEGLPWIEGGCLRCHYAVSKPVHEVSLTRCAACHDDVDAVTQAGIGEDLHPAHAGNTCGACHEEDNHQIEAMSSAVDLQCADCHTEEHGVEVDVAWLAPSTCDACHAEAHQGEQRLLLGILPDSQVAAPSNHFMDGLTCRSCHLPLGSATSERRLGSSVACVQCHRPEYATILRWWNEGIAERTRMVERYLSGAEQAVAGRERGIRPCRPRRAPGRCSRSWSGPADSTTSRSPTASSKTRWRTRPRPIGSRGATRPPLRSWDERLGRASARTATIRLPEPGFSERMDDAFHREVLGRR